MIGFGLFFKRIRAIKRLKSDVSIPILSLTRWLVKMNRAGFLYCPTSSLCIMFAFARSAGDATCALWFNPLPLKPPDTRAMIHHSRTTAAFFQQHISITGIIADSKFGIKCF
jgi:hypothetical protein